MSPRRPVPWTLLLLSFATFSAASDLRSELTLPGVSSFFPGDPGYANATRACESCFLQVGSYSVRPVEVNLRFTLEPVAVLYPETVHELANIVKIGKANHLRVSARSGGVSSLRFL